MVFLAVMPNGQTTLTRRSFLQLCGAGGFTFGSRLQGQSPRLDPWADLPSILAPIRPPKFPARDFVITEFGGSAKPSVENTEPIAKAIAACSQAGGGRVVIPSGEFLTGPIHLKSHVNLYLAPGAVLKFVTDPQRYLPVVFTRWEGTELMNYSPFIYA